ncbi:winged helix-turn-helix transcriptional regulator [Nocardia asteroides]|uniref:winged helix-turn-helix transcriptional regulator n=1 Tax=Nocardia asteroides TaxID=1824 RepID=UPI003417E2BD
MALAVLDGPRRFNEIKRRSGGVTQRVLTQALRRLERDGLVERRVLPTSPSASSVGSPNLARRFVRPSDSSTTRPFGTLPRSRQIKRFGMPLPHIRRRHR